MLGKYSVDEHSAQISITFVLKYYLPIFPGCPLNSLARSWRPLDLQLSGLQVTGTKELSYHAQRPRYFESPETGDSLSFSLLISEDFITN